MKYRCHAVGSDDLIDFFRHRCLNVRSPDGAGTEQIQSKCPGHPIASSDEQSLAKGSLVGIFCFLWKGSEKEIFVHLPEPAGFRMGEVQIKKDNFAEFPMFFPQQMERFETVDGKRDIRLDRIRITGGTVTFTAAVDIHAPDRFRTAVHHGKQGFHFRIQTSVESKTINTVQYEIGLFQYLRKAVCVQDSLFRQSAVCVPCFLCDRFAVAQKNAALICFCQQTAYDKSITAIISFSAQNEDLRARFKSRAQLCRNRFSDLFHQIGYRYARFLFNLFHSVFVCNHRNKLFYE